LLVPLWGPLLPVLLGAVDATNDAVGEVPAQRFLRGEAEQVRPSNRPIISCDTTKGRLTRWQAILAMLATTSGQETRRPPLAYLRRL
jgi:hypothetical protein